MSSLLFPVGPERPGVYWVRRLVLLAAVGMLLVGVWFVVGGRGGDAPVAPSPDGTAAAVAASPTAETLASDSTQPLDTVEPTLPAEPLDCSDDAIKVDGTSDSSSYAVGTGPVLTLTITNIGDLPCLRDVGPKANEIEVTSGGYHVWSSDDCNASDKTKVVTLQPGEAVSSSITWSGVLSRKGCPEIKREAKAGRYEVVGRNGKVRSDPTPFALTQES